MPQKEPRTTDQLAQPPSGYQISSSSRVVVRSRSFAGERTFSLKALESFWDRRVSGIAGGFNDDISCCVLCPGVLPLGVAVIRFQKKATETREKGERSLKIQVIRIKGN